MILRGQCDLVGFVRGVLWLIMSHSLLLSKATACHPCFWPGLVAIANVTMSSSVEIVHEMCRRGTLKCGMRFIAELR